MPATPVAAVAPEPTQPAPEPPVPEASPSEEPSPPTPAPPEETELFAGTPLIEGQERSGPDGFAPMQIMVIVVLIAASAAVGASGARR
ncbi:hypothetical protein [Streptomonospora litoralis]|uniref:hypothetical protein n=1 Tax=Streptomonospora litoralis TaxID=2498135 RepID=UPI001036160F|nr:hypothetical protein [Streptomonospora litoralis]